MSIHRRAAKRDENEPAIVKTLRAHGCVVWLLSGTGITDLVVMRHGRTWLADVKMPGKYPTKPQEDLWEKAATKARVAVFILRTPEDAAMMLNSALPPWEPMARTEGLRQPSTAKGKRKPDATLGAVIGKPPFAVRVTSSGYTPPRQPPGDPRAAEVFAPPASEPPCVASGRACRRRTGKHESKTPPEPRTPGEAMMVEMLKPPGKGTL